MLESDEIKAIIAEVAAPLNYLLREDPAGRELWRRIRPSRDDAPENLREPTATASGSLEGRESPSIVDQASEDVEAQQGG